MYRSRHNYFLHFHYLATRRMPRAFYGCWTKFCRCRFIQLWEKKPEFTPFLYPSPENGRMYKIHVRSNPKWRMAARIWMLNSWQRPQPKVYQKLDRRLNLKKCLRHLAPSRTFYRCENVRNCLKVTTCLKLEVHMTLPFPPLASAVFLWTPDFGRTLRLNCTLSH